MAKYRNAQEKDAEQIAKLHARSWQRTYRGNFSDEFLDRDVFVERNRVWCDRLKNPAENQLVCVAEERGTLCGFICVIGQHDPQWGSFIDNLHVANHYQGLGIGAGLMRHAGTWLSRHFAQCGVFLLVWELNPARMFYEHLGGRNTGIIEVENPDGSFGRYIRFAWDQPKAISRLKPQNMK